MAMHLRAWRRFRDLTLQQVAARLGISHTTLLRYEKGAVMPPDDAIRRLAQIYDCTPAELQVEPQQRRQGQRVHLAIELAQNLPPEIAERWIEIGRILMKEKD
jgi:transcriptional regulator with XRE-family HTH domain